MSTTVTYLRVAGATASPTIFNRIDPGFTERVGVVIAVIPSPLARGRRARSVIAGNASVFRYRTGVITSAAIERRIQRRLTTIFWIIVAVIETLVATFQHAYSRRTSCSSICETAKGAAGAAVDGIVESFFTTRSILAVTVSVTLFAAIYHTMAGDKLGRCMIQFTNNDVYDHRLVVFSVENIGIDVIGVNPVRVSNLVLTPGRFTRTQLEIIVSARVLVL
jgi:hypothetical protein